MAINLKVMMVESKQLAEAKGELVLTHEEATKNGQIIGIASSQVIDWIYGLRGMTYEQMCGQVNNLKQQMKQADKEERKAIKKQIDDLVFVDEVVRVTFTRQPDFKKSGKGFTLNGNKYVFIL